MTTMECVKERVHKYHWEDDTNCATINLKILAKVFTIELDN